MDIHLSVTIVTIDAYDLHMVIMAYHIQHNQFLQILLSVNCLKAQPFKIMKKNKNRDKNFKRSCTQNTPKSVKKQKKGGGDVKGKKK